MDRSERLKEYLDIHRDDIHPVVDFGNSKLFPFDFTEANPELSSDIFTSTEAFSAWVNLQLIKNRAQYGIGGYNEHRTIYSRSPHFDTADEPRRLHLGVDIWGPAGTPVFVPLKAKVHSFKFNDNFGDYGATIILEHDLDGMALYSLYGHLNLDSLKPLVKGMLIQAGEQLAQFGVPQENGHWPPHLHFQLMFDMQDREGDYPGVCRFSERDRWLANCPDPALILNTDETIMIRQNPQANEIKS